MTKVAKLKLEMLGRNSRTGVEYIFMERKNKIFVDADSCPVKEEIMAVADGTPYEAVFVASYAAYGHDRDANWIFVDQEREAADLYIINHVRRGDIVVTQDMGLAAIVLTSGVSVLSVRGKEIKEREIAGILDRRYRSRKARLSGVRFEGPKAFTDKDRKNFSSALTKLLCRREH